MTEAEQVCALMESVINGERTCREVSDLLEINLQVIERVAGRMTEQLLGLPPAPMSRRTGSAGARRGSSP